MLVLKDVLDLVWNRFSQGGGKEFQPDKYLTDSVKFYPSHISVFNIGFYYLLFS